MVLVFRDPRRKGKSVEGIYESLLQDLKPYLNIESYYFDDTLSFWTNRKKILKLKPALVHITSDIYNLVPFLDKTKTIITIHDLGRYKEFKGIKQWIYRFLWLQWPAKKCDAIVSVSAYTMQDILVAIGSNFAKKVSVIHNPVPKGFHFSEKFIQTQTPVILAVGTASNKNIDRLIEAVNGITCMLVFVGELTKTQEQILASQKTDFICYKDLTAEEIKIKYEECDLVYFVSLHEGFGMPVIEAQAIGRPVLVSDRCSLPEVAGQGAHFISNPQDPAEIRNGILRILNDTPYRQTLIDAGKQNVRRFSYQNVLQTYLTLYKKVLARG